MENVRLHDRRHPVRVLGACTRKDPSGDQQELLRNSDIETLVRYAHRACSSSHEARERISGSIEAKILQWDEQARGSARISA